MGGNNNKPLTLSIHKLLSSQSCACLRSQTTTKYIIPENTRRRGVGSRNFLVRLRGPNLRPPPRNTKKKHAPTKSEGKTGYTCERKKRTRQTSTQKPKAAGSDAPTKQRESKRKRREWGEDEREERRRREGEGWTMVRSPTLIATKLWLKSKPRQEKSSIKLA